MASRKALGRGLSALIPQTPPPAAPRAAAGDNAPGGDQSAVEAPLHIAISRIAPNPPAQTGEPETPKRAGGYRPWAELLARTFALDVLACPRCQARMKLLAMVTDPASIARYLAAVGEATEVPRRSPSRGPPYWKSRVLRRQVLGDEEG